MTTSYLPTALVILSTHSSNLVYKDRRNEDFQDEFHALAIWIARGRLLVEPLVRPGEHYKPRKLICQEGLNHKIEAIAISLIKKFYSQVA